jgi:hypothetical protein
MYRDNITVYLLFSVHRCMFCASRVMWEKIQASRVGKGISMKVFVDVRKYHAWIAQYYWSCAIINNIVSNFIWFTHIVLYNRQGKTELSVDILRNIFSVTVCLPSRYSAYEFRVQGIWSGQIAQRNWWALIGSECFSNISICFSSCRGVSLE